MKNGLKYVIILTLLIVSMYFASGLRVRSQYDFRGKYMIWNVTNVSVVGDVTANAFLGSVDCSNVTNATGNLCTLTSFDDVSVNATHNADNTTLTNMHVEDNTTVWAEILTFVSSTQLNATFFEFTGLGSELTNDEGWIASWADTSAVHNCSSQEVLLANSTCVDPQTYDTDTDTDTHMGYANVAMVNDTNVFAGKDTWSQETTYLGHNYHGVNFYKPVNR